jgi:hypothetical protein
VYPKLKTNISELILANQEYIPVAYVGLHCKILALIKITVCPFVDTGGNVECMG